MQNLKRGIQFAYLALAVMTWIFFYNLTEMIWNLAEFPVPTSWFIMPSQIFAFLTAIIALIILQRHSKVNQYATEVASELNKVTWPEKKETVLSTGIVSVMIAISAMLLFGFDSLWGTIIGAIYN